MKCLSNLIVHFHVFYIGMGCLVGHVLKISRQLLFLLEFKETAGLFTNLKRSIQ